MRILVTGGNGQLGSALKARLDKLPGAEFLFTDVDDLDITNSGEVRNYFKLNKPAICINCAGYTAVDKAEENKEVAFLLNSESVKILSEACAVVGAKLIHISTDYVFNGHNFHPYVELDIPNASSIYGQSKAAGEENIKDSEHCIVIRTSWLYSEFGGNFFKTMDRLMDEKKELGIVADQIGTPTYAGDLADVILTISGRITEDDFIPGIFHYSNEGVASWYDFAWEIARLKNSQCQIRPLETHEFPLPAPRPHYSVLNKNRIKKVYGVSIPHWRESLIRCFKIYKK